MSTYIIHADFIYIQFPVILKLDLRVVMRTLTSGAWPPTEATTQALLHAGVGDHQHISCFVIDHICNAKLFSITNKNKNVPFHKKNDMWVKVKAYKTLPLSIGRETKFKKNQINLMHIYHLIILYSYHTIWSYHIVNIT